MSSLRDYHIPGETGSSRGELLWVTINISLHIHKKKYTFYAKLTSLMATIMESKQGLTIKGELKILRKYYLMLKVQ
jgi:hypothetical protein